MIQDERGHYTWVDDDLARRAALPSANYSWREWGERWRSRFWWLLAFVVVLVAAASLGLWVGLNQWASNP